MRQRDILKDLHLRKITEEDANLLVQWRNENADAFPPRVPLELAEHIKWFDDDYLNTAGDLMYVIEYGGCPIGTIGIRFNSRELGIPREINRVMLGNKNYARDGFMSAALTLLMETFGYGYYELRVLSSNQAAVEFYKKNYFSVTGQWTDTGTLLMGRAYPG